MTRGRVAEYAPNNWRRNEHRAVGIDISMDARPERPKEVSRRLRKVVEEAKSAVAAYRKADLPILTEQGELAAHAIRLAKLDSVYRGRRLDPTFEQADPEDVQDLLDMLTLVPFNALLHPKVLFLNPSFGDSSRLVRGADTDLIAGDLLLDFKATIKGEIQVRDLDQVLGYYLLARNQRRLDAAFPMINRLGIYYCRHAPFWTLDTGDWTDNPAFPEIEEWFFKLAEEVFGSQ